MKKFQTRECAVCHKKQNRSLEEALADEKTTEIAIDKALTINNDVEIPSGKTVEIANTVTLSKGTLTNDGKIVMAQNGVITITENKGTVMNNGEIDVINQGKLKESENIINRGNIIVKVGGTIESTEDSAIIGTGKVIFEIGTYKDPETSEETTSTEEQIVNAITNTSATEVKLISDFTVESKIDITKSSLQKLTKVADFDLNGYTIKSDVSNDYAIVVNEKINLTIKNGSIISNTTDGRNIINKATLTLNKVTMKGYYNVVSDIKSTTNIIGGEYTATYCGIFGGSESKTTISGATVTSDAYAVSGNGSKNDTTFTIKDNSVITSKNDVAIYMPSTKLLQVVDSKVTGNSGIETAAGDVEIINSEVVATAKGQVPGDINENGNKAEGKYGSVNDRSALLVISRKGYGNEDTGSIKVTIKNSTLTSVLGKAIRTHVNMDGEKPGVKTIVVTYDDATVLNGDVVNDKTVPNGISITVNGEKVPQKEA